MGVAIAGTQDHNDGIMLLDFIYFLLERGRLRKHRLTQPSPTRTVTLDPIVLECPLCNTLTMNAHQRTEEGTGDPRRPVWIPTGATFLCPGCNRLRLSRHFENDGTGVMRLKRWTCRHCQAKTLLTAHHCSHCGRIRPFEETDYGEDETPA